MAVRSYVKPGAYVEWRDASATDIHPLRTDIAGFAGYARRGPIDTPVPVESYRQFEANFGSFSGSAFLAYAVRAFFENGGRRCWVVRVASRGGAHPAAAAFVVVNGVSAAPRWRIRASSAGVWGDALEVSFQTLSPAQTASEGPVTSTRFTTVSSVSKFERGDLVRIQQPGGAPLWRVVSHVDAVTRRLYWVHPEPGRGLRYDAPLAGLDFSTPLQIASTAYALHVREHGRLLETFAPLALVPEHRSYGPAVLAARTHELGARSRLANAAPSVTIEELAEGEAALSEGLDVIEGKRLALRGGAAGLAGILPFDFIGEPLSNADSDEVRARKRRGLRALDDVDEIAIVAAPDVVLEPLPEPVFAPEPPPPDPCAECPPRPVLAPSPLPVPEMPPRLSDDAVFQIQSAMIQMCEERRDRFALLDPPLSTVADAAVGQALLREWRARFETRQAALYYPWLRVVDPLALEPTRRVPASGHVAGQYAFHDLAVGPHRAPANRVLEWAQDAAVFIDDTRHGELNESGVNAIRVEPGRGLRILGARTLSSDTSFRFVNVRRLVSMVMKAVDVATQWAVFEPNDERTRQIVTQSLSEFLLGLWRRGALVGPTPDDSFAVRCDGSNNPPEARAEGRLIADVALAPSQPFEFVILRVGRQGNQFEIQEQVRA